MLLFLSVHYAPIEIFSFVIHDAIQLHGTNLYSLLTDSGNVFPGAMP
jgi:hypothetical protein